MEWVRAKDISCSIKLHFGSFTKSFSPSAAEETLKTGLWLGSEMTREHLQWFHAEHWTNMKDEDEKEEEATTSHHLTGRHWEL